jgi:hypothetical protein
MTALGKVLVFFVLLLALIWTGLTVNVYATRTNWANAARDWEKKAKEAQDSANYQRNLAQQTRDASAARIASLQTEVDRLQGSTATLNTQVADLQKKLGDLEAVAQQAGPAAQALQANIARLQKQVDLLQGSLSTMEKSLNEATIAAEKAKGNELKATIDRDAALKRADDLETRVLALTDQLADIRSGRTGVSARLAPPDDFRATVTKVDGDQVEINLGANAKLQKGAVLSLWRAKPQVKYLGSLTITLVDPFGAVGTFSPPPGVTRPAADDRPKAGDTAGVVKP